MLQRLLALVLLCLLSSDARASAYRITFDPGGVVDAYVEKYNALRLAGGQVIIDGACLSACTLVAGLIPAERVCVTAHAFLGFHSASETHRTGERHFAREYTRIMWRMLSERVRELVRSHGWDGESEHEALVFVEGEELRTIFAECESD